MIQFQIILFQFQKDFFAVSLPDAAGSGGGGDGRLTLRHFPYIADVPGGFTIRIQMSLGLDVFVNCVFDVVRYSNCPGYMPLLTG